MDLELLDRRFALRDELDRLTQKLKTEQLPDPEWVEEMLRLVGLVEATNQRFKYGDLAPVFQIERDDARREWIVREAGIGVPNDADSPVANGSRRFSDASESLRACDKAESLSHCLIRREESSRRRQKSSSLRACDKDRPHGKRSSPDFVLEQRLWVASLLESPFVRSRKDGIALFEREFGLKTRAYDRRLAEIRAGWRPPFRRSRCNDCPTGDDDA